MKKLITAILFTAVLLGMSGAVYAADVDAVVLTCADVSALTTNIVSASIRGTIKAFKIDIGNANTDVDIDITGSLGETLYTADDVTADTVVYLGTTLTWLDGAVAVVNTNLAQYAAGVSCVGAFTVTSTDGTTNIAPYTVTVLYEKK